MGNSTANSVARRPLDEHLRCLIFGYQTRCIGLTCHWRLRSHIKGALRVTYRCTERVGRIYEVGTFRITVLHFPPSLTTARFAVLCVHEELTLSLVLAPPHLSTRTLMSEIVRRVRRNGLLRACFGRSTSSVPPRIRTHQVPMSNPKSCPDPHIPFSPPKMTVGGFLINRSFLNHVTMTPNQPCGIR